MVTEEKSLRILWCYQSTWDDLSQRFEDLKKHETILVVIRELFNIDINSVSSEIQLE